MSGLHLAKEIRDIILNKEVKIVLATATTDRLV